MKFAIAELRGHEGRFVPNQNHIEKIFKPWFSERGWEARSSMFVEKVATLISLKGSSNATELGNLIPVFYKYITEEFKGMAEKMNYPALYLDSGIEVVYNGNSTEQDDNIFAAMALQKVLKSIPMEIGEIEERINNLSRKFRML